MKKTSIALAFTLSTLSAASTLAQETTLEENAIVVVGLKDPQVIPYASIRKGEEAFRTHRSLAPTASLRFALWPHGKSAPPSEPDLRLISGEKSLHIQLNDRAFTLPNTSEVDGNPELTVINFRRDSISWSAKVRSPDLPPNTLRLGDLRLECEVNFATFIDSAPLMIRMGVKMLGQPCRNKKANVYYTIGATATSVELVSGERHSPLAILAKGQFSAPLSDMSWPDDSMIILTFGGAPAVYDGSRFSFSVGM